MEKTINAILSACSLDGKPEHAPAQFKRRVEKAAGLVKTGKVFRGYVLSQEGDDKAYYVKCEGVPKVWSCTCPDFRGRGGYDTQIVFGGYGRQCKHTLAQIIAYFEGLNLRPYAPSRHTDQCDFWQGMSEEDADRICNPKYQAAMLEGGNALLMYFVDEVLARHGKQILRHADDLLKIGDCNGRETEILAREISSSGAMTIYRIFEIPEIDGESYSDFWPQLYEAANNGQLAALKSKLIDELNN
jgi:hypothetical protein